MGIVIKVYNDVDRSRILEAVNTHVYIYIRDLPMM